MKHALTICMSLLCSVSLVQAMKKEGQLSLPIEKCNENNPLLLCVKDKGLIDAISHFHKFANEAHKYDKANDMFKGLKSEFNNLEGLSKEQTKEMLMMCCWLNDNQVEMLKNSIKFFMQLSCLSKEFNDYLTPEKIGSFCEVYGQSKRDLALNDVLTSSDLKYMVKRLPMLILVYAGANVMTYKAETFEKVVENDDISFAKILFQKFGSFSAPTFWHVKTKEMAQLYVDNQCFDTCNDTVCLGNGSPNYLWNMIGNKKPLELMKFYCDNGYCPRKLFIGGAFTQVSNICLLHGFAMSSFTLSMTSQQDADLFLEKAEFVLGLVPDMINHVGLCNEIDKTPLDMAYASLENLKESKKSAMNSWNTPASHVQTLESQILAYEQLIALYRNHGALTAQELAQQK